MRPPEVVPAIRPRLVVEGEVGRNPLSAEGGRRVDLDDGDGGPDDEVVDDLSAQLQRFALPQQGEKDLQPLLAETSFLAQPRMQVEGEHFWIRQGLLRLLDPMIPVPHGVGVARVLARKPYGEQGVGVVEEQGDVVSS